MNWFFENIFLIVFLGIAGSMLFKVFKNGGFKGAMFGASVKSTLGEVSGSKQKLISTSVKVHSLNGDQQDKLVGIEFIAKSIASYQMMPISLSATETRKLISLLEAAVNEK